MTKRVSELENEHKKLGAGLGDWNDMDVAWSYATSAEKEHDAVREAAGLFDVSALKKIWITGADAAALVDHVATRDMSRIYRGKSAYNPLLTDEGTICDDNIIFHIDDNKYLYVHGAGSSLQRLQDAAKGRDVEVRFDDELHDLSLQGQKALPFLQRFCPAELDGLAYFHQVETELFGRKVLLSRTGYSGERGYEIFVDRKDVVDLWNNILGEGESDGIMACSFNCLDKIRIEAGLLFYPYDMSEEFTPWEVGLGWTISRKKPGFLGRDALMAKEGKEKVRIAGVSTGALTEPMEGGAKLYRDGQEVGVINSPGYSHRMKKSLALVHVDPTIADGTILRVGDAGTGVEVTVDPLPFFDPNKANTHA
ncbi:aminomethyltransferase family protein [Paracoccus aminovorans]|uniref:aminomethyltransferase family protein n=1 Tax=Paracoccus aminovorans TaxID=34004 RepID=UPI002B263D5E|nr:aminomethyltransferase family protein [Paracoccus aminovorans]